MKQRGMVSMLTAIMMCILFISLALGLVLLANAATQQASDDELSLRAYAGAYGGIEWAQSELALGNFSTTGCIDKTTTFPSGVVGLPAVLYTPIQQNSITCLKVKTNDNNVIGTVSNQVAHQITLGPGQGLHKISVSWLKPGNNPAFSAGYNGYAFGLNPALAVPAVELTIVRFTTSSSCTPPACTVTPGAITVRNVALFPNNANGLVGAGKQLVACSAGFGNPGGYACQGDVDEKPANDEGVVVYIRGLYAPSGANYQLQFLDGSGSPIDVPLQTATVDVTARSGPVYRRIRAQIDLGGNDVPAGLNYVLFGDKNVCKDFSVYPINKTPTYTVTGSCPP